MSTTFESRTSEEVKKRTKSRNGCVTCKRKRLKCDEGKPSCLNCQKKKIECGGYATSYKWRSFNDEPEQKPKKRAYSESKHDDFLKKHLELASISVTGKTPKDIEQENDLVFQGGPSKKTKRSLSTPHAQLPRVNFKGLDSLADAAVTEIKTRSPKPRDDDHLDLYLTPNLSALINFAFTEDKTSEQAKLNELIDLPLSPLALTTTAGTSTGTPTAAAVPTPGTTALFLDPFLPPAVHAVLNASLAKTSEQEQILHLYTTYTCSIMSIKNGPNENPWRNRIAPLASSYSCLFNSIAAMTLFHLAGSSDNHDHGASLRSKGCMYMKKCIVELATGLSKMNDDEHQLLPADIALATCLNLAVSEAWDTHTSSGIAHLKGAKSMIQRVLSVFREYDKLLADRKKAGDDGKFNFADVKRKLVLVEESDWEKMAEMSLVLTNHYVPRGIQFLFNIWVYFEVLAQMTTYSNYDDKGIDLVATITTIVHETEEKRKANSNLMKMGKTDTLDTTLTSPSVHSESSDHSFAAFELKNFNYLENFDKFGSSGDYVDPLLGCAQSLFLIMGKVANLICKINKQRRNEDGERKFLKNSLSVITQATLLKQRILDWKPAISVDQASYESGTKNGWDLPSCIATAELYRYATLLYLHQAVPELPSLSSHQLAERILILMASIPTTSDLFLVHIFPLLVASCEAQPGDERDWCESRWGLLSRKMHIGNIDRALEVVKEVWRRKDEFMRKKRRDKEETKHSLLRNEISGNDGTLEIGGLMASMNNVPCDVVLDDINGGITSRLHWSSIMREWDWEVMLG